MLDTDAPGDIALGAAVKRPYIGLSDIGGNDEQVYTARGNLNGTFTIPNVPSGLYQLVVWDKPLDYIIQLERAQPDRQIAVIIPELVERRWYHAFLHTHSASLLKALLLFRGGPQIVIVSAPWYLRDWIPEQQQLSHSTR